MHASSPLLPLLIFLLAIVIAVPLASRLRLGAVLGYLGAGMLIGPHGLGWVHGGSTLDTLSELGVVLLLFLIGLELSPQRLWVMRRQVFGYGAVQVLVSAALLGAAAFYGLRVDGHAAGVIGLGLALSSTAFGLQILAERKELPSAYGRLAFALLLFQDLAAIPLIAAVPLLAPGAQAAGVLWPRLLQVAGVVLAVVLGGRLLLRPLFRIAARVQQVEVSTAMALLVALGTAWLVGQAGASMALGAFLAGLLLADSEYRHELESNIEPFKGLLLGLFFISVGMAANLPLLLREPLLIALLVLALLLLKAPVLYVLGRTGLRAHGAALKLTVLLAGGGEFAFVVFQLARAHGLLDAAMHQRLVLAITLSMALTPLLVAAAQTLLVRHPQREQRPFDDPSAGAPPRVIIAGYGRVGQIVARVLHAHGIAYTALEHSIEQVETSRRYSGMRIFFGDPGRPELLRAAQAAQAEVFVLATDDPETNLRTARLVRRLYPGLKVVARARNRQHAYRLMDLQPHRVVRETFHSSLVMARQVLETLGFDAATAAAHVERFRQHDESLLRSQHEVYDDEAKLMQSTREALADLERLFEADAAESDPTARAAARVSPQPPDAAGSA
ncbi:monovalent cation:proton antiporter-2 (CPA2) family protein [Metallibacterium scheffleri]|uniref:monovalent cation:proton antiporter-2 (CPA2) family protein n=3 Tax=Metallibacterium TaxID=1218803 RepID=UPI0026EA19AD|nr:monovalent cation:proton antiporter-2 (CPA2) family protein [Metallibacterium scheffleri]MBW8073765.1 glutathione-regulated potassium-efflux system protein KefB [Metallibacterium scheffleri]